MKLSLKVIAKIKTDFPEKFGIPRQSGIVEGLTGKIIFEPPYRDFSAVRELEEFSHIWLLWGFSLSDKKGWSPTVRPPRLGGNKRVGVFATRSPYRPNPLALSAVRLLKVERDKTAGPVLTVAGIDMADGTPIYDIKPYIAYADAIPNAVCGFAGTPYVKKIEVEIPQSAAEILGAKTAAKLREVLSLDPRPRYQDDPTRVYGFSFSGFEIKFTAANGRAFVTEVKKSTF